MSLTATIAKIVRKEIKNLEEWSDSSQGLSEDQLVKLEKLARISRQLDLTSEDEEPVPQESVEEMLAKVTRGPGAT